jgi:hypothetical protein
MTGAIATAMGLPTLFESAQDSGRILTAPPSSLQRSVRVPALSAPARPARAERLVTLSIHRSAARLATVRSVPDRSVVKTSPSAPRPVTSGRPAPPTPPAPKPDTRELAAVPPPAAPAAPPTPAVQADESGSGEDKPKGKGKDKGNGKGHDKQGGQNDDQSNRSAPVVVATPPGPPVEPQQDAESQQGHGQGNGHGSDHGGDGED